ncbi:MAG: right-handed parallel beta-helix repeat-containing protein [Chlamydiales bacterium]|nr:right-handed parallel beta-helix repeat-containing protein [Chlamydiales bacterium]
MNIFARGKCKLAAYVLAAMATAVTLPASADGKAPKEAKKTAKKKKTVSGHNSQFVLLSQNLELLKSLSQKFHDNKNPALSNLVNSAIQNAETIVAMGTKANPIEINKALSSVNKVLNQAKHKHYKPKHKIHHVSSSDSSDADCNFCPQISELESEVAKCCSAIKTQIIALLRFIQAEFPCDAHIAINNVPYVISQSGKYCVTRNLVYNGSDAAITVNANNVTINFENHSLTLNDPAAQGILVQDVSEFTLENDIITGSSLFRTSTSAAVALVGVQKATLTNIYTANTTKGVMIEGSNDVRIENAFFQNHEGLATTSATIGAGVWVDASSSVTIEASRFVGANLHAPLPAGEASNAILVQGDSSNVTVQNSSFTNWLSTMTFNQINGALIDHCTVQASGLSTSNMLQLGSMTTEANDITIMSSTFTQNTQSPGFDGMLFLNGSGCMMEDVIVDVTTVNDTDVNPYFPGAVHVGCAINGHQVCSPILAYDNILAKNCIIKGVNQYGLLVENGAFVTFTDSQFTDASVANIFLDGAVDPTFHQSTFGARGCVIKDSTITSSTGNGVLLNPGADTNAIIDCDISNNGTNGIVVSQYAHKSHIRGNSIHGNGSTGITSNEGTTAAYFNTSCKNTGTDCVGITPAQQPTGPGAPVAGSNICCTP